MLTPDEISSRRFLVSLRGYDRDEVHAFLRELAGQVEDLQNRHSAAVAEVEELRGEAERLRARAERTRGTDAEVEGKAARAPAEKEERTEQGDGARRPFAEIGEETQRILEAAQEAGNQITRKARHDADRELQKARRQAAKAIAEGERRRESIEQVVSELESRRASLTGELRQVGQTIDRILGELSQQEQTSTVREAVTASVEQRAASGDSAGSAPVGKVTRRRRAAGGTSTSEAPAGSETGHTDESSAPVQPPPGESEVARSTTAAAGGPEAATGARVDEEAPGGTEAGTEEPAAPQGSVVAPEAPAASTETLAAPAEEPAAPVEEPAAPADEPAAPAEEPSGGEGAEASSPTALRVEALEPLHPKMVRRVKRGLSDLQNIALDRLRREGERAEPEALALTDEEMGSLGGVAGEFLAQAYQAGVAAAAVLAGRSLAAPDVERDLAEGFVAEASGRVRDPLASTLRMGLGAEESLSDLNDRIGAVFSELKSAAADELSASHLIRAYELGLLDAWSAGGVGHRGWVLGREPRCPEGRCRQNDQSGAVSVTQTFPSGHDVPPVHVGCTCTTIPVLES